MAWNTELKVSLEFICGINYGFRSVECSSSAFQVNVNIYFILTEPCGFRNGEPFYCPDGEDSSVFHCCSRSGAGYCCNSDEKSYDFMNFK